MYVEIHFMGQCLALRIILVGWEPWRSTILLQSSGLRLGPMQTGSMSSIPYLQTQVGRSRLGLFLADGEGGL